jgi:hypothetical protein
MGDLSAMLFALRFSEPLLPAACGVWADGEVGELVALIKGTSDFVGYYKNSDATDKKILRDAFVKVIRDFRYIS